jgi:hypothetical protein
LTGSQQIAAVQRGAGMELDRVQACVQVVPVAARAHPSEVGRRVDASVIADIEVVVAGVGDRVIVRMNDAGILHIGFAHVAEAATAVG